MQFVIKLFFCLILIFRFRRPQTLDPEDRPVRTRPHPHPRPPRHALVSRRRQLQGLKLFLINLYLSLD